MKWYTIILLCILLCCLHFDAVAQEQQLENLAERSDIELEDDAYEQELERFRKHPVNLNTATADDLERLQLLNALQVDALIQYRTLLGAFINLYELQAVPHWDVATIQKVLPYISVNDETQAKLAQRFRKGEGSLTMRLSQTFPKPAEYDTYTGPPQKIFMRYRYSYKNVLQWGLLADKDAGERMSPDFYSAHLFMRNVGVIHSLAIGDFALNLGQGLIQWQSLGFRKSTEITAIKRQSAVLRPYTSAGEYNFHRGAGITLRKKHLYATVFASLRKLDANTGADSASNVIITSFITSGLHRTIKEIEKKNNVSQRAIGFNISYKAAAWHIGASGIHYQFSHPVQKRDEPYNYYAFNGSRLSNYSIDYDYTVKNVHLFGELAVAYQGRPVNNKALLQGMLISLDRKVDASLVFRHLQSGFQSLYSTAFTENSLPSNESGLFMGLSIKPVRGVRLDMFADVFSFPWLKLRADRPSTGREFLVQFTYEPNKRVEVSSRFRFESKQNNDMAEDGNVINLNQFSATRLYILRSIPKMNWRLHAGWQVSAQVRLRQRVELTWFDRGRPASEAGYLIYNDIAWHPQNKPFTLGGRVQLFETDGFNSRIYAYENDVPGSYSIAATYHKGLRYYVNSKVDVSTIANRIFDKKLTPISLFLRWSATASNLQYPAVNQSIDRHEYKAQLIFSGF